MDIKIENQEYQIHDELLELKKDIESLEPCLERQIKFFEQPLEDQIKNIKNLMFDIREEASIIGYEEKILKDLKKQIDIFEIEAIMAKDQLGS